jgi:nucleoside-diphosphate-sugar epimerase
LKRLRATGVRVTLVDDMDKEYAEDAQAGVRGALVHLSEFDTYDALARKLVDLRRAGQAVVLDLAALK